MRMRSQLLAALWMLMVGLAASTEPYQGVTVCLPAVAGPDACAQGAPEAFVEPFALPARPWYDAFPGVPIPATWYRLPDETLRYARVVEDVARFYPSPQAAAEALDPIRTFRGLVYVSYDKTQRVGGRLVYHVGEGYWMNGQDLRPVTPSSFRGYLFPRQSPAGPFGWARFEGVRVKATPGYETYDWYAWSLPRRALVHIYEERQVGAYRWLRIGPEQWVEAVRIAEVHPRSEPPPGVPTDRWIEVNVAEQTLAVYDDGRLIAATLVSTGTGQFYTRQGVFRIAEKLPTETMRGAFTADKSDAYLIEDVPWTMYYDGQRALHGAYWHDVFGFRLTHGCVNLSLTDAAWLFAWAREGDWVYVWDPTGETPFE